MAAAAARRGSAAAHAAPSAPPLHREIAAVGRARISDAAGGADRAFKRQKRIPGLKVVPRDGFWHVHGTIRVAGRSLRVRKSTGLPATAENRAEADAARFRIEEDFRNEVLHGVKPSIAIEEAALAFLEEPRERPLNLIDVARIEE